MKILLLEPHPDDAFYYMGGYILKHPEHEYYLITFSDCETLGLIAEHQSVINGHIKDLKLMEIPRRKFSDYKELITDELFRRKKENFDIVFCPSDQDTHQDHKVINQAALTIFGKDTSVIFYDGHNYELVANMFEIFYTKIMDQKIELLSRYKTQKDRDYFHPEFIRASHIFQKAGQYAEKFKIYKLWN